MLHYARVHTWQGDARKLNRTHQSACVKSPQSFMCTVHPENVLISCLMMPIEAAGVAIFSELLSLHLHPLRRLTPPSTRIFSGAAYRCGGLGGGGGDGGLGPSSHFLLSPTYNMVM